MLLTGNGTVARDKKYYDSLGIDIRPYMLSSHMQRMAATEGQITTPN